MRKKLDLVGQKFNRLTVVKFSHSKNGRRYWECRCDCGNMTTVGTNKLTSLRTKSCGCARLKHGASSKGSKGSKANKLYRVWEGIKQRCNNHNDTAFHNYGARGITVSPEWANSFDTFATWALENGWKHGLDLDRIDNDKGYSARNCRVVDRSTNNLNTRMRKNNTSGFRGVNRCTGGWEYSISFKGQKLRAFGFKTPFAASCHRDIAIVHNNIPAKIAHPELIFNMVI